MSDALDALQRIVTRRATKAQIIAESGGALEELRLAYATDTSELGIWTNGAWVWIGASAAPSGAAGGNLSGTYPNPTVAKVQGVAITDAASTGAFLRKSGALAATWALLGVADYPYHDEPLTDGAGNLIFAGGDIVVVTGVPN